MSEKSSTFALEFEINIMEEAEKPQVSRHKSFNNKQL